MTIASSDAQEINPQQRELISYALKHLRDAAHGLLIAINEKPAPTEPAASPSAAPATPPE